MSTHDMGMKIEEWEDGRVNIGIAVCPQPATILKRKDTLLSNRKFIVPKSAFVIRTPESHQSQGVRITYCHHETGVSDLIIMLSPRSEDQGLQDEISQVSQLQNRISTMKLSQNAVAGQNSSPVQELVLVSSTVRENNTSTKPEFVRVGVTGESGNSPGSPQALHFEEIGEVTQNNGKLSGEAAKKSTDMKRVSWIDDSQGFENNKGYNNNSKESKKDSVRKSNGGGNRSPTKKQNAFTLDTTEAYSNANGRGSGDKSRIPVIASSAVTGDYPTSCEFYRRKMLNELYSDPSDNWYGYSSIQRYAGQKVVRKIAAEQKRLEEDISNRRKTEIWILGSETDDFMSSPHAVPLRKKTTRLKPMQIVH